MAGFGFCYLAEETKINAGVCFLLSRNVKAGSSVVCVVYLDGSVCFLCIAGWDVPFRRLDRIEHEK